MTCHGAPSDVYCVLILCFFAGTNIPESIKVFPQDRLFKVGNRVTFYCVLPVGYSFEKMYLSRNSGTNMTNTMINNHIYALTVNLSKPSKTSCTDVKCQARTNDNTTDDHGACAYIGCKYDLVFS